MLRVAFVIAAVLAWGVLAAEPAGAQAHVGVVLCFEAIPLPCLGVCQEVPLGLPVECLVIPVPL
jgi:hypothetical protein